MSETTKKTIWVANLIAEDPVRKIVCPYCDDSFLQITILPWPEDALDVDIHMYCDNCKERATMTKKTRTIYKYR